MNKTNGAADRLAEIALHYGPLLVILTVGATITGGIWALNYFYG